MHKPPSEESSTYFSSGLVILVVVTFFFFKTKEFIEMVLVCGVCDCWMAPRWTDKKENTKKEQELSDAFMQHQCGRCILFTVVSI